MTSIKFFAESTQYLLEQRQAATQTYLTVNTAIFAVLAFLVKDANFRGWPLVLVSLPLFLVGILVFLIWYKIITQYKTLIGWHYSQLTAMEQGIPENHWMYLKEGRISSSHDKGRNASGFLGWRFGFCVCALGCILSTALDWWSRQSVNDGEERTAPGVNLKNSSKWHCVTLIEVSVSMMSW